MKFINLPPQFNLYWSSVWAGETKKSTLFFRLITQLFTKSRYEHVAGCVQCPTKYDGLTLKDNKGLTILQAGEYYVFEANKQYGFIVTPLIERLSPDSAHLYYWSGSVDIQTLKRPISAKFIIRSFNDYISMLGRPYAVFWAVFSAFDNISIVKSIYKILNLKPRLDQVGFCSAYNFINWCVFFGRSVDKEAAVKMTPEEVSNWLIKEEHGNIPQAFLKAVDGKIIVNEHYIITL